MTTAVVSFFSWCLGSMNFDADEISSSLTCLHKFKRATKLANKLHRLTVELARCKRHFYSLISRASCMWNILPIYSFPVNYNFKKTLNATTVAIFCLPEHRSFIISSLFHTNVFPLSFSHFDLLRPSCITALLRGKLF